MKSTLVSDPVHSPHRHQTRRPLGYAVLPNRVTNWSCKLSSVRIWDRGLFGYLRMAAAGAIVLEFVYLGYYPLFVVTFWEALFMQRWKSIHQATSGASADMVGSRVKIKASRQGRTRVSSSAVPSGIHPIIYRQVDRRRGRKSRQIPTSISMSSPVRSSCRPTEAASISLPQLGNQLRSVTVTSQSLTLSAPLEINLYLGFIPGAMTAASGSRFLMAAVGHFPIP